MDASYKSSWEKRLARQLLARHLQVSFPLHGASPDWLAPDETWLPPGNPYALDLKARRRVVAVIGAGASWPALSLGEGLADRLQREIGVHHQADYDLELVRLQRVYGLPDDFETRLVALCRRPEDERKARERISEWCGISHPSMLAYELVAHLLKHRYLDAVVSFNFDELLDQSLEDELGRTEYVRVLSERDCRHIERDPDLPDYVPLYIKMHGTASEPESLRFTRESYYRTPKPIIDVVERLLDAENLVVVSVGCRLASFDFQYLLRAPRNVALFHINPKPLDERVRAAIDEFREQKTPIDPIHCGQGIAENEDFLPQAFRGLMAALEREVESGTSGLAKWRSVGRHRMASELLDTDRMGAGTHTAEYLRQRTVLEMALATAKGRGVVSTTSLVDERCGHYYELYLDAARKENIPAASWPTVCSAGGLIESDDSSDVYYADEAVCALGEPPAARRMEPETNHTLRAIDAERLAVRVLAEIDSSKWTAGIESGALAAQAQELAGVIRELFDNDELEIHSLNDRVCSKVFVKPFILPTHTAFRAWSRKLLEGDDYDEIRVVAETGGWIGRESALKSLGAGKVKVIVAFDGRIRDLKENLNEPEVRRIPWWCHNRHMRLLCCNDQPVRALYYARLLRTTVVTPVFLQDAADLKRLKLGWDRLWQEAGQHEDRLVALEGDGPE